MKLQEAFALLYEDSTEAPFILAKEKGKLAEQMIKLAKECNIPIYSEPDTANILSLYDVGDFIPEETYKAIADIFSFIRRNYGEDAKN